MVLLIADKVKILNGVTVKEFFLTKHNPNGISLPAKRNGECIGVTIHNTNRIKTAQGTTAAEQYLRATMNGNMGTVRVHFYVDDTGAWQGLPLDMQSWHAGQQGRSDRNGSEKGNGQTVSIEVIMDGSGDEKDMKARDNAARLAAYLLDKYGGQVYTHNYWCNLRNGRTGSIDELNRRYDGYKGCPVFLRPKWDEFTGLVKGYRSDSVLTSDKMYYVQVGAFKTEENAQKYLKAVREHYPDAFIKIV